MHKKNNIIVANIVNGISNNRVSFLNTSGLIIEHTPNIKNIFAILLPTTFPIAKSEWPSNADVTLTTNQEYTYYIIVWFNEKEEDQIDEGNTFYGKVEFNSSNGTGVTSTF